MFPNISSQAKKLSINAMKDCFQVVAFPWILAVKQVEQLKEIKTTTKYKHSSLKVHSYRSTDDASRSQSRKAAVS